MRAPRAEHLRGAFPVGRAEHRAGGAGLAEAIGAAAVAVRSCENLPPAFSQMLLSSSAPVLGSVISAARATPASASAPARTSQVVMFATANSPVAQAALGGDYGTAGARGKRLGRPSCPVRAPSIAGHAHVGLGRYGPNKKRTAGLVAEFQRPVSPAVLRLGRGEAVGRDAAQQHVFAVAGGFRPDAVDAVGAGAAPGDVLGAGRLDQRGDAGAKAVVIEAVAPAMSRAWAAAARVSAALACSPGRWCSARKELMSRAEAGVTGAAAKIADAIPIVMPFAMFINWDF